MPLVCLKKYAFKTISDYILVYCLQMLTKVVVGFPVTVRDEGYIRKSLSRSSNKRKICVPWSICYSHIETLTFFFLSASSSFLFFFLKKLFSPGRFNKEVSSKPSFKALTWRNKGQKSQFHVVQRPQQTQQNISLTQTPHFRGLAHLEVRLSPVYAQITSPLCGKIRFHAQSSLSTSNQ